jgi:hypothetical protein
MCPLIFLTWELLYFPWYIMGVKHDKVRKNKAKGKLKRKNVKVFLY